MSINVLDEKQEAGKRFDAGKTRWDLLPFDALNSIAEVYTFGAKKYADRNWEKGMSWSRCVACLMRHLFQRMRGERLDEESGLPHLAHAAWNAIALLTYDLRNAGTNDIEEIAKGPRSLLHTGGLVGQVGVATLPYTSPNVAKASGFFTVKHPEIRENDKIIGELL